jgi:AcrR family transcriptional regulator
MAATAPVRIRAGDRREQIMDAAKELFARQGFEGTTTRQIAERARVNEAIIFRHFPTKEDLYWAVLDHQCTTGGGRQTLEKILHSGGADREVFAAIAEEMLRRRARDSSLTRLLLYSALENHRLSDRFFRTHVAEYFELLAKYVSRRIRQGAFRPVDPLLAARGFLGMVVYHSLVQEVFGWKRFQAFDVKEVSEALTDIWLQGMTVRDGKERPDCRPERSEGPVLKRGSRG